MTTQTALVVEDNVGNLVVLDRLLARQGIQTISVMNPANLDNALKDLPPIAVAFLDLELPMSDGFAVMDHLRSDPRLAQVPIVAYTVSTSRIGDARAHGFDGFLGKPLDADHFPDQLRRILGGEPVWE